MNKIQESANEIYSILGDGYGFNGSKEDAIKILDEKITAIAKHYADKAFVAGRSKSTWKQFYLNTFLSVNNHEDALVEMGLLCDHYEFCQCAKDAMSRGANRYVVEGYEKNCPNRPLASEKQD